jgi:hypothetical protein
VAAEVKRVTGLDAELVVGGSGEFTVWLDDKLVAEKKWGKFPSPEDVVAAVKAAVPSA